MLGHILKYAPAQVLPAIFSLLNLAAFTRFLSPHDYGTFALIVATTTLLNALLGQWLLGAIMRFYVRTLKTGDTETLLFSCGAYLWLATGLLALGSVGYALIADNAFAHMAIPFAILYFVLLTLQQLVLRVRMAALHSSRYSLLTVAQTGVSSLAAIGFVLCIAPSPAWAIIGMITGCVVPLVLDYKITQNFIQPWRATRAWMREIMKFAGISALSIGMAMLSRRLGLFIAFIYLSPAAGGALNAAQAFVEQSLGMVFMVVAMAAHPLTVHTQEGGDTAKLQEQMRQNALWIFGLGLPSMAGFMLIGSDLIQIVLGEALRTDAVMLLPWLCVSAFLNGVRAHYITHSFFLANKNHFHFYLSLFAVALSGLLAYILIPPYGLIGAAVSLTLLEGILTLIAYVMTFKAIPLPLRWMQMLLITLATLIMSASISFAPFADPIANVAWRITVAGFVYVMCLFVFNIGDLRTHVLRRLNKGARP